MIEYLKNTELGLVTLSEPVAGCWIHVLDPTPADCDVLVGLGIPHDFLTYPLDLDERARTEREDGVTLIVLRIPIAHGPAEDVPFATVPLGIILTDLYIVTVCRWRNQTLDDLIAGRIRDLRTAKRARFVLYLLLTTAKRYLAHLGEINKAVDSLEDELQRSTRNREVLELLKYQKSLTYFTTALKQNELMLARLQRGTLFTTYPEDEELLEDVITENRQAIEMSNIASNILSSMMDAFASIISNNLNAIMKLLASVTIVLSLPTVVSSFYGMNVRLPGQGQPLAFTYLLAASALITVLAVVLFWRRDWF